MARTQTLKNNYNGGEISPNLYGRSDLPIYQNGAKTMENAIPQLYGGCKGRFGFGFISESKSTAIIPRLIGFVFSASVAYVLEVGDNYIRFYRNKAQVQTSPGVAYELATPYAGYALIQALNFCQKADAMIFFHPTITPQRLRRYADTNWTIDAAPFLPAPFDEIGDTFANSLTLSSAAVGAGITVTASAATFLNGDVGRTVQYQSGYLTITAYTSATVVTGTTTVAFPGVAIPVSAWVLGFSPQETITPSDVGPIGAIITLTSAALNIWRATDVGKYVSINGGLVLITVFTTALVVSGRVIDVLVNVTAAPKLGWALYASMWGGLNGYPSCGTFHQQRLVVAGSPGFPQTIWGSRTGLPYDFTGTTDDDSAFAFTLESDQINAIQQIIATDVLIALTNGGEWVIKGGVEKALTPTNVQAENQTSYGAANVRPIRVGKDVVYVQRSGNFVMGFAYDATFDVYDSDDLTVFADHILSAYSAKELAFTRTPDPIIWVRNSAEAGFSQSITGLCGLTFSRKQNVIGWFRVTTENNAVATRGICVIPSGKSDQLWAVNQRTINGVARQYIEVLDNEYGDKCSLDSYLAQQNFPAQTVWPVPHLEAKTVAVVAGGIYKGTFLVTGGNITLNNAVSIMQVGLPYTGTLEELQPEIPTPSGVSAGQVVSDSKTTARLSGTYYLEESGAPIQFRQFGSNLLDDPLTPFSGLYEFDKIGWDHGVSPLIYTAPYPFPWKVLGTIRTLVVNA